MNNKKMSISKPIVSVTDMSRIVELSRARFYQLLDMGFFPKPLHDERSKRPYYDLELQQKCLECRQSGIGADGSYMLFYSPRKSETVSHLKKKKTDPQIKELTEKLGVVPKEIELIASNEELVKRRLLRHIDAKERLSMLLDKEKKFSIKSNLWGIQGARIADIINREGVADYRNEQISRSVSDFDKVIPTKDMDITDCIKAMLEISNNEKRESSFLVLHTDDGEKKLVSDLVVGKDVHSIIGVTLLEVYVGFRQDRSVDRAYKHAEDGKLEVIHSFTPAIQEMTSAADLFNSPDKGEYEFLSDDDVAAATRFDVIVSVIEADGNAESTSKPRQKELEEIMSGIVADYKDGK